MEFLPAQISKCEFALKYKLLLTSLLHYIGLSGLWFSLMFVQNIAAISLNYKP